MIIALQTAIELEAGTLHTARALLVNPTVKEFTYSTELYLGADKAATSGPITVTIPAGGSVEVGYPVVMPLEEAVLPVFLDVWHEAELLVHYQATQDVRVKVTAQIDVGPIIWE